MSGDGGDVDDLPAFLRFHRRQHGGDAVEDAANVDVDDLVPFVDFQLLQQRQRHDAGVVEQHVNAAIEVKGALRQRLHLCEVGDVGPHAMVVADAEFVGELMQAVEATGAEDDVRTVLHEMARGFGTEAA